MSRISTHVLDIARGVPARDVPVQLERREASGNWQLLMEGRTDPDGRCGEMLPENATLVAGPFIFSLSNRKNFSTQKKEGVYSTIPETFILRDGEKQYHLQLRFLLN